MFRLASMFLMLCGWCTNVQTHLIAISETRDTNSCAFELLAKYVGCDVDITTVELKLTHVDLTRRLHDSTCYRMVSRSFLTPTEMLIPNQAYIITTGDETILRRGLRHLSYDMYWNPRAYFLFITDVCSDKELEDLFHLFLHHHLDNVVLLTKEAANKQYQVFTYYPYGNNACGRSFNRLVRLGSCNNMAIDPFANKFPDTLAGCSITMVNNLVVPFTFGVPAHSTVYGIEETILLLLSQIEHFQVDYIYRNSNLTFGSVFANYTTTGLFRYITEDAADGILGGVMLTNNRLQSFDCIHSYMMDRLLVYVPRAGLLPRWSAFYRAFSPTVWILVLLVHVSFIVILLFTETINGIRRRSYNSSYKNILDIMVYNHFRKGTKYSYYFMATLIVWIWTTWFLNCFYQTALASVMTRPGQQQQIDSLGEVISGKHKLFVAPSVLPHLTPYEDRDFLEIISDQEDCDMLECLSVVARGGQKFTIGSEIYIGNSRWSITDNQGEEALHQVGKPYFTVADALYFRRGFPALHRLQVQVLRIASAGFVSHSFRDISHRQMLKFKYNPKITDAFVKMTLNDMSTVYALLGVGYAVSVLMFIHEIRIYRNRLNRR